MIRAHRSISELAWRNSRDKQAMIETMMSEMVADLEGVSARAKARRDRRYQAPTVTITVTVELQEDCQSELFSL